MAGARRGQGRSSGGELHLDRGCAPAGWAGGGGTRCGVGVRCSGLPVAGVGVGQGLVAAAAVDGAVAEQVVRAALVARLRLAVGVVTITGTFGFGVGVGSTRRRAVRAVSGVAPSRAWWGRWLNLVR